MKDYNKGDSEINPFDYCEIVDIESSTERIFNNDSLEERADSSSIDVYPVFQKSQVSQEIVPGVNGIDSETGFYVKWVMPYELPPDVKGICNEFTNTILVDITYKDRDYVLDHERGHALHGSSEIRADRHAVSRHGYIPEGRLAWYHMQGLGV
ncbi:hypothetical protein GF386_06610 [Candidatus Pacearchaeota archaeon]|nr:hypothetical protein [Candidatus Pacearchaeota archaeon]MBD3283766.1 hypothetical protein [Candidatus Pacearchaeota archaeon]